MVRNIDSRVWLLLLTLAVTLTFACSSTSSPGPTEGPDGAGPSQVGDGAGGPSQGPDGANETVPDSATQG